MLCVGQPDLHLLTNRFPFVVLLYVALNARCEDRTHDLRVMNPARHRLRQSCLLVDGLLGGKYVP